MAPTNTEPLTPAPSPVQLPATEPVTPEAKPLKSMRERILEAENAEAITALLSEGDSDKYKMASNRTRNRWKKAASKRKQELA